MSRRRTATRSRKTNRRWHIPPPLVHGSEALEGGRVLQETPGALGVILWQALRDVLLWAQTPPADRGALFAPGAQARRLEAQRAAAVEPRLEEPLRELAALLGDAASTDPERVSLACRAVAQWAEAQGRPATALAFAQDAALATPADPAAAFAVGRIARVAADYARAEVWFRRTIGLARQSRDWRLYSHAFLGLGTLYERRGNLPLARQYRVRALRGARRGGLRNEQGLALHDLFVTETEAGRFAEAERYAGQALAAYSPRAPRLPMLAHDVAYFWMEHGFFRRALRVFEALLPVFSQPVHRLFALSDIARAAGGSGDAERFEAAWGAVWRERSSPHLVDGIARALVELAHGAASLGQWDRAVLSADLAYTTATLRNEAKTRLVAEALLQSARARQHIEAHPPADLDPETIRSGDRLAEDFVQTLSTIAAPAP